MRTSFPTLVAALAVWLIPLFVALLEADEAGESMWIGVHGGWLAAASIVCAAFRNKSWIVPIWVPVTGSALFGMVALLGGLVSAGGGGASAAPSAAGVIVSMLGILALLACVVVNAFWFHPKVWSGPFILIFAVMNALAAGIATSTAVRYATRMDIVVHLLDQEGNPLAGAIVHYRRFGCGPEGRTIFDEKGGPILSGNDGVVVIPSRQMRYETRTTISKDGYRHIGFTLGMQLGIHDRERDVTLLTRGLDVIAGGKVAATNPVQITLYVPHASETPIAKPKRIYLYSKRDLGEQPARYLDLSTGKFSSNMPADLKLELSPAIGGSFANRRLHIVGLNGLELQMIQPSIHFDGVSSTYEQIYGFAPTTGYHSEITLEGESYTTRGRIYIRSADQKVYYRLHLEPSGDVTGEFARYSGELFISSSGSGTFK